jgi:hypothetical protein
MSGGPDPFGGFYERATGEPVGTGSTERRARRNAWTLFSIGIVAAAAAALAVVLTGSATPTTPNAPAAIARAINVRQSDLAGFTVEPNANATISGRPQERFNRCVGLGTLIDYVRDGGDSAARGISSPQFTSGSGLRSEAVSSTVGVEASRNAVANELAQARSQLAGHRVQDCLDQALDHVTYHYPDGRSIALGAVHVYPVASPAGGTDGQVAIEVEMMLTASTGVSVPVYMDMFGFGVGRDALSLLTFGVEQPFPFATELRLASLMVSRATRLPH